MSSSWQNFQIYHEEAGLSVLASLVSEALL